MGQPDGVYLSVSDADSSQTQIRGLRLGQCWGVETHTRPYLHAHKNTTSHLPRTWTDWPGWDYKHDVCFSILQQCIQNDCWNWNIELLGHKELKLLNLLVYICHFYDTCLIIFTLHVYDLIFSYQEIVAMVQVDLKAVTEVRDSTFMFVVRHHLIFLRGPLGQFLVVFASFNWDLVTSSSRVCCDQKRYFKPKYNLFPTLSKCFLCGILSKA